MSETGTIGVSHQGDESRDGPGVSAPGGDDAAHPRSLRRRLAAIVLGFECVVVFLAALMMFGLKNLPPGLALGGGAVLLIAIVLTIRGLRYRWGIRCGWVIQGAILAAGFVNPALFFVGGVFTVLWAYSMWKGSLVDRGAQDTDRRGMLS